MKHNTKKILVSYMALSMLAGSLPALAATTVINNFKVARDTAINDGAQYFSFSYGISNPGADFKLGADTFSIPNSENILELSGNLKYKASKFIAAEKGKVVNIDFVSGGKTKSTKIYVYQPIKFASMKLTSTDGSVTDDNETLLVKQGFVAGQTITPVCNFDTAFAPEEKFFVIGGQKLATDVATSVNALPVGKSRAICRGVNYESTDKKKPYIVDGKSGINLIVLAKPEIINSSIRATGAITTKNGRCLISAKARNTDDVEIKWTGKNLTKLTLSVNGKDYNIPAPKRDNATVYFQPDCLTVGNYSFALTGENTGDYKVAPVVTPTQVAIAL